MSVSIGGMFRAGVVPGILIGLSQMLTTYVCAKRYGYPVHARSSLAEFAGAMAGAGLALITPLIIVGGIFTAAQASVVAVLHSLVLGTLVYRTVGPAKLAYVLYDTGRLASACWSRRPSSSSAASSTPYRRSSSSARCCSRSHNMAACTRSTSP